MENLDQVGKLDYVCNRQSNKRKFEPKSLACLFLGYTFNHSGQDAINCVLKKPNPMQEIIDNRLTFQP
jgi:hypothetical protein